MKTEQKKTLFLSYIFQHLDGIALIPTILALEKKMILSSFTSCTLSELSKKYDANNAYLNVALRLLCSQGFMKQTIQNDNDIYFELSKRNTDFKNIVNTYNITAPLYSNNIDYSIIFQDNTRIKTEQSKLFQVLNSYLKKYEKNPTLSNIDIHVEGAVLSPILVILSKLGCFENTTQKWYSSINKQWLQYIQNLLTCCRITDKKHILTEYGRFIIKRTTSYGVTVSYLPTFRNIPNLLFGDYKNLWTKAGEVEKHVDRSMNVWGSGGAHHTYFKKVDEIILDLFNLPIEEQPKGFIDIGCGNGKLIEHIFDLIYYNTKRGKYLKEYPLFIVGSDFNYKALEATKITIEKADIWAKTAFGDISEPKKLAKKLKEKHEINLEDLLNVRSFLDHNRIYTKSKNSTYKKSNSTAAFCYQGKRILNHELQQNLKEHFKSWYPYLKKYGLLIVELHTIDPQKSAQNIGKTAITAYDATHGFSDQYIIEYNLFLEAALDAGLKPDKQHEYTFPSDSIPIVSINRLVKE